MFTHLCQNICSQQLRVEALAVGCVGGVPARLCFTAVEPKTSQQSTSSITAATFGPGYMRVTACAYHSAACGMFIVLLWDIQLTSYLMQTLAAYIGKEESTLRIEYMESAVVTADFLPAR